LSPGKKTDLLVVGHVNLDHELAVPYLPGEDRTVPVIAREVFLGGTACNVARWASGLGLRVSIAAFVGEDFPKKFRDLLRKEKVDVSRMSVRKGYLTPSCWIARDRQGRQVTIIDQGAMAGTAREALPDLAGVGWVHVGTGDPRYLLRVARAARKLSIPIASDPAQEIHYRWSPEELREMLGMSEVFFGNQSELERALTMLHISKPAGITDVVPLAVITMGARGVSAYTRRGIISVPSPRVKNAKGVTGAGDAFRGAFYSGWLAGKKLETCLARGTRAGAAVAGAERSLLLPK
jgi:sugar/nucleoside kinase (ribokinase family)